jgi:deoxyribodipyrimidine photolyase
MRVEENPALDVARELATRLDRPLLPVAVVGGRHRFNNDRHLTFALEGLRDLQLRLRRGGLDLAVLVRRPEEPSIVARLARTASLVVTEEMPAAPWPRWLEAMAASTDAPLVAVDASCLVPMSLSRKAPDRAFVFRDRFAGERRGRMAATWPACRVEVEKASLPEGSLDLAGADDAELAAIVASLDVDHSVGPVFDTPGGSEAGEARWAAFRAKGLKRYARDRNDAVRDGVSRMSAYLHYGMVSPFRIAREAGEDGAEKYLDELLIWRELAWHWASRTPDHDSIEALPRWARRTLEDHRGDPRERIDDETLERGLVGEPVWDLAQRSLRRQGELHNNVRMTWGKAIPGWSASPEEAIRRLFDLNHRYALDGSDPSSANPPTMRPVSISPPTSEGFHDRSVTVGAAVPCGSPSSAPGSADSRRHGPSPITASSSASSTRGVAPAAASAPVADQAADSTTAPPRSRSEIPASAAWCGPGGISASWRGGTPRWCDARPGAPSSTRVRWQTMASSSASAA